MKRLPITRPGMRYVQVVDFLDFLVSGESISWVDTSTRALRKISEPAVLAATTGESSLVASELTSDGVAKITFAVPQDVHDVEFETKVMASTSLGQVYIDHLILPVWAEQ